MLGNRIRKVRKVNGLSQSDFSKKLQIHQTYISKIERGQSKPSILFLKAVCLTFAVNEEWLLEGKGEMTSPHMKLAQSVYLKESLEERKQTLIAHLNALSQDLDSMGNIIASGRFADLIISKDIECIMAFRNLRSALKGLDINIEHLLTVKN